MIPKITSHEFNDILNSANNKLNDIIEETNFIKTNISKKQAYHNYYIFLNKNYLLIFHLLPLSCTTYLLIFGDLTI